MKKTLVALAALAVAGGAFAQSTVSITGEAAFGFQSTTNNEVTTSGFGVDTAAVKFSVTEDLGGGLKLGAAMQLANIARGNAVGGEDFTMTVAGGFGKVLMGQIEIGSGIRGLAQADAPVNNMEGEILGAATLGTDIIKYYAPAMGPVSLSASWTEEKALGVGISSATSQGAWTVGADYAAGPLAAKIDYSTWNNQNLSAVALDNRYRVAASYDLGMVKFGAGYEDRKNIASTHTKQSMVGVSAPIGSALTVGAVYARVAVDGSDDRNGASVGLKYALSKRTSLQANYSSWDDAVTTNTGKATKTWIALDHTF